MTRSERESIDYERRKLDGHGDRIKSRTASEEYRQNFDRIQWRKRKPAKETACPT